MSSTSNLSPVVLSDKDKLKGYENYASWKILMEAHGMLKGLHKYWRNMIIVPAECVDTNYTEEPDEEDNEFSKITETPKAPLTTTPTATYRPTSTPLHSTTPLELEYELREAVALSSIIINV
jgi:hypothetical protein